MGRLLWVASKRDPARSIRRAVLDREVRDRSQLGQKAAEEGNIQVRAKVTFSSLMLTETTRQLASSHCCDWIWLTESLAHQARCWRADCGSSPPGCAQYRQR